MSSDSYSYDEAKIYKKVSKTSERSNLNHKSKEKKIKVDDDNSSYYESDNESKERKEFISNLRNIGNDETVHDYIVLESLKGSKPVLNKYYEEKFANSTNIITPSFKYYDKTKANVISKQPPVNNELLLIHKRLEALEMKIKKSAGGMKDYTTDMVSELYEAHPDIETDGNNTGYEDTFDYDNCKIPSNWIRRMYDSPSNIMSDDEMNTLREKLTNAKTIILKKKKERTSRKEKKLLSKFIGNSSDEYSVEKKMAIKASQQVANEYLNQEEDRSVDNKNRSNKRVVVTAVNDYTICWKVGVCETDAETQTEPEDFDAVPQ